MPTGSEERRGASRNGTRPAIEGRGVSKGYKLGEMRSLHRKVWELMSRARGKGGLHGFLALDHVDFEVPSGECFAVVGSNGSGKSTLIQLISGISVPTAGEITVRGRVLPLLEIGAGFHTELTGRENIYLFGTILGLGREQIEAVVPRIMEFSELGEAHLDTPLKRYSMGMQARLSFAVAMRFPADIYIFDEVMAVVDDHFREMAIRQIRRLIGEGATVIFISHDLDLVREICTSGMWLDGGKLRAIGPIEEVAPAYSRFAAAIPDADRAPA